MLFPPKFRRHSSWGFHVCEGAPPSGIEQCVLTEDEARRIAANIAKLAEGNLSDERHDAEDTMPKDPATGRRPLIRRAKVTGQRLRYYPITSTAPLIAARVNGPGREADSPG